MQYIASVSYGKDSLAMLEVIKEHNMPLNRIVHVEIMATDTIPADLPPMVEFKKKADRIILERYGIEVEHIHAPYSFEEYFYKKCVKGKHVGMIHGFPMLRGSWCVRALKTEPLGRVRRNGAWYLGIAADEPNRYGNLNDMRISPLVEHGIDEAQCFTICGGIALLSPTYTQSMRGGCWFCPKQPLSQLRLLRKQYPEYWALLLEWDRDSPVSFKPDGISVHGLDRRFAEEDLQIGMFE